VNGLTKTIDGPVSVIGDVHGQLDMLVDIIEQLRRRPDFEERWLVFIGDFVDRGTDPCGVMDLIVDLMNSHQQCTAIAGNHELAMAASLGWIPTPEFCNWDERWVNHYDSESTFESYGATHGDLTGLNANVPEAHKHLIADLPWCVEHPQYLFVHAGLDPNIPFDTQLRILRQRDFSLTRPPWLCSKTLVNSHPPRDCRATVVSGHEYVPEVQFSRHRILLDTTGGRQGDMSCVLLPEKQVLISSGRKASHTKV